MKVKDDTLAQNIKYLRKKSKLSQEEFADRLGIKRSSIAAYESKNVEPRLRIILEMARIFDIDLKTMIETRLEENSEYPSFNAEPKAKSKGAKLIDLKESADVTEFIDKSMKIRKVLEGFKAFYAFKKKNIKDSTPEKEKIKFDIDNFIQLMEHLLTYNEFVIKAIQTQKSA